MSNLMSMVKLRNKVSRNGFDLSRKNVFSAKVGELLPVTCIEAIPGDKIKINLQSFTRTMPVNTAAYTRIREYFDVFFVPTNLMWNKFNTWVTQMTDNNQHAIDAKGSGQLNERMPYFRLQNLTSAINQQHSSTDIFGYNFVEKAVKLLNYLDYGHSTINPDTGKINENVVASVNPFPLLAYQKIYADYFRNSQWEKPFAPAFNVDYSNGGDLQQYITGTGLVKELCQLRYCNWNKDLFMGFLPSAQYGDSASVNGARAINMFRAQEPSVDMDTSNGVFSLQADALEQLASGLGINLKDANGDSVISFFNVLQLRQAEALQKWAEITQSQQQDYKSQVKAHFNVNVSDAYSERCRYLGGTSSNIDISEVVNTNLSSDTSEAVIAGKGVGSNQGFIEFDCDVHGYVMVIYHAVPLLDYSNSGIPKMLLKTLPTDFAIPEFDSVGMTQLSVTELTTNVSDVSRLEWLLGYVPRYYDYKTAIDKVHGAFIDGGLDSWVAPFSDDYISKFVNSWKDQYNIVFYPFFKVNPAVLEPIFMAVTDGQTSSDQLLVNSYFDIKAVRNLDVNGLPY